jgi:DNA transformation protein
MSAELITHLLDLLAGTRWAGRVRSRRMFGGYGLYCDDRMAAIVMNDTLYLKTDPTNRPQFLAQGLAPFIYSKKGVPTPLSYYQAPAEALEDGTELAEWLESARQAAVRAALKPRKPSKRQGKRTAKSARLRRQI